MNDNKVYAVYERQEMDSHDCIMDNKVYLSKEKAEQVAKDYNKGNPADSYYVDYLDVD